MFLPNKTQFLFLEDGRTDKTTVDIFSFKNPPVKKFNSIFVSLDAFSCHQEQNKHNRRAL